MVDENPIKLIWRDRSALLQHPVRIHPLNYAGELMEDKIASCNELLKKRKIDAMVLTHLDSVCWLLNIRGDDVPYTPLVRAFIVVNAAEEVTVFSDVTAFPEEVAHYLGTIRIVPMETFPRFLSEFSEQSTVFIDPKHTPMAVQKILDNAGAQVVCGQDICLARKAVKNPKELQGARNAHLRDGVAMCMFLAWLEDFLKTGEEICESEIANRLYMFRQDASDRIERGTYLGISFPSIVAFNENAAVVHYRPRLGKDKIIKGDGLLLIDSGGQYVDGTTDVTRTLAIGNVNDAQRKIFTRVLKGLLAVSQMLFPSERSMVGCSMDVIARMVLWRAGFDYLHGTGHGVGSCLSVHESPPSLTSSRAGEAPLVEGMIMSCEPGYYREGEFGMRIENLLAVKSAVTVEGGDIPMHSFATLTLVPIDRRLIFPSLLTSAERNWIDRYHAKIIEKVTQYLDPKTQLWLEKACSPLGNLKDMLSV
jgi:Xaa-Pro aminopeptidase